MFSIKNLFRDGPGPSSQYSLHPHRIAKEFKDEYHDATTIQVTLYGKLIQNNSECFIEQALKSAISPCIARIINGDDMELPQDVTVAKFQAFGKKKRLINEKIYYFNKLGETSELNDEKLELITIEKLLNWTYENGRSIWEYALIYDSSNLEEFMQTRWEIMKKSIKNGLEIEGGLPCIEMGDRRASLFFSRSFNNRDFIQQISKTMSYSLAVIEESASAKNIVAVPTAKSCGIIPGVLYSLVETYKVSETRVIRSLITAGIIGRLLYKEILNGNILTDISIAIAMASASATQIMGGTPKQILASAAIALNNLENDKRRIELSNLNYIELNALGASKALDNATWALLSDKNISKEIDFLYKITTDDNKDKIEV